MSNVTPLTSARAAGNVDSCAPVADAVEFDTALSNKLGQSGPRYTSYPSADHFSSDFGYGHFLEAQDALRQHGQRRPLSLYVHIPFYDTVCYYCACNKVVTKNKSKAATYLRFMKQEIAIKGKLFAGMNQIE
jgi:oxygen-independent coproporphyrinogen-3 oxidase